MSDYGKWYYENTKSIRHKESLKKYGIDKVDFEILLKKQKYSCAICSGINENKNLNVDHDHKTGKVRGLLCDRCNRSLGLFKDDIKILKQAIKYLNKNV